MVQPNIIYTHIHTYILLKKFVVILYYYIIIYLHLINIYFQHIIDISAIFKVTELLMQLF